jgi:hypothetical protein
MRKTIGLMLNVLKSILIPQQEILDMKNRCHWVAKVTRFHRQPTGARKLISEMYTLRFQQNNGGRIRIFRALSPHWRPKIALITSVSLFVLRVMIQPEQEICCFRLLCIFPCSFVSPEAKHMEIKTLLLTVLEKLQITRGLRKRKCAMHSRYSCI